MAHEMLLTVKEDVAELATPINLIDAGLLETKHLQRWVIAHPAALGEGAMVVSCEFNKWTTSAGKPIADRLDVLAMDQQGRLIVAELKRDKAPDTITMQAINYAAMVSRMSLDDLAAVHAAYLGHGTTAEQALDALREWAPEVSDETLSPPRIVLLAGEFGPTVTNTALFLVEQGLDLRLVRYQLYRLADQQLALSVSQLIPVPEAEEFMVRPKSSPATQAQTAAALKKNASIPRRLVDQKVIPEGAPLTIAVPAGVEVDQAKIRAWLEADPHRATVIWRQDPWKPVVWAVDDTPYNLTTLITKILLAATGEPPTLKVWGPNWYRYNGVALRVLVDQVDKAPMDNQG